MDAEFECCRLCGESIDENGGDGLCCECFFNNADREWLAEYYPHLVADDDSDTDDEQPRKRPRRHAKCSKPSKSSIPAATAGDLIEPHASDTRSRGWRAEEFNPEIRAGTGGLAGLPAEGRHHQLGAASVIQFQYSTSAATPSASTPTAPFSYLRAGMTARQLNAAARAERAAKAREHERFSRALLAAGAEAVRLATVAHLKRPGRPWDPDAEYERLTARAKLIRREASLASILPPPGAAPRRAPPRSLASRALLARVALFEARLRERAADATARRAEAALAASREPPPKAWLVEVEPFDFIGKEPCQLKMTWHDGQRMWTTTERTAFGEQLLAERRA